MIEEVVDLLSCPQCGDRLEPGSRTLGCPTGHTYDVARQGYVNLLGTAAPKHADTAAMVQARADFLDQGHYRPLAERLAACLNRCQDPARGVIVEAGAGTGYYLARTLAPGSRGIATDISAYACRRAARRPHIGAVVADTWRGLPVRAGCADGVLVVFAPRNMAEFARIVRPGGSLVVATPMPHHLAELRETLGLLEVHPDKAATIRDAAAPWFDPVDAHEVSYPLELDAGQARLLVAMGPNAFHTRPGRDYRPVRTGVGVRVDVFTARARSA